MENAMKPSAMAKQKDSKESEIASFFVVSLLQMLMTILVSQSSLIIQEQQSIISSGFESTMSWAFRNHMVLCATLTY